MATMPASPSPNSSAMSGRLRGGLRYRRLEPLDRAAGYHPGRHGLAARRRGLAAGLVMRGVLAVYRALALFLRIVGVLVGLLGFLVELGVGGDSADIH